MSDNTIQVRKAPIEKEAEAIGSNVQVNENGFQKELQEMLAPKTGVGTASKSEGADGAGAADEAAKRAAHDQQLKEKMNQVIELCPPAEQSGNGNSTEGNGVMRKREQIQDIQKHMGGALNGSISGGIKGAFGTLELFGK